MSLSAASRSAAARAEGVALDRWRSDAQSVDIECHPARPVAFHQFSSRKNGFPSDFQRIVSRARIGVDRRTIRALHATASLFARDPTMAKGVGLGDRTFAVIRKRSHTRTTRAERGR